jgi:hypothetical protein
MPPTPHVQTLIGAIESGETIIATGFVLQELLQGFFGKARAQILDRLSALPFIGPDRNDHIEAADLKTQCRQSGIQIGTIDALLAQLCIRHGLMMLSTDRDFERIADLNSLKLWRPPS